MDTNRVPCWCELILVSKYLIYEISAWDIQTTPFCVGVILIPSVLKFVIFYDWYEKAVGRLKIGPAVFFAAQFVLTDMYDYN